MSNLLVDHFASVSSHRDFPADFLLLKQRTEQPLNFLSNEYQSYNCDITSFEIAGALRQCNNTAPGHDEISYQMLRHLSDDALESLRTIYNTIWNSRAFPAVWRHATVLPFLKQGKPAQQPSSYRPIALTSCMCKLLERIVNNRLVHYLESHSIISPFQYGFRKMRGPLDALVRLESSILDAFALNRCVVAVFFDIVKAYDTTWRYNILRKLHTAGIRGALAFFIHNFVSHREFKVLVGSSFSRTAVQEEGVPQGSVLSVTLFLLAINDVTTCMPEGVSCTLYVDDLTIFVSSSLLVTAERRLQLAITRISSWLLEHGFRISAEKTASVFFHRRRGVVRQPDLHINNTRITVSDTHKFLGIIFDQKLRWVPHIQYLRESCASALSLLRVLSHTSWGADTVSLLRLYRALIRSKLDYGCQIYSSASPRVLSRLDPIHNTALRICTGAFKSSPVRSLCVNAGEPSLQNRRNKLALQYYVRLKQTPDTETSRVVHMPHLGDRYRGNENLTAPFGVRVTRLLAECNIPPLNVLPFQWSPDPCFQLDCLNLCRDLLCIRRADFSDNHLRLIFLDHFSLEHTDSVPIYTDGSKNEEGVGCSAVFPDSVISKKLPTSATIFTAELFAILLALCAIDDLPSRNFTIFSDSTSALHAITQYNSNHVLINRIQRWIIDLASRYKTVTLCWVPSHVNVTGNEHADREAKSAALSQNPLALINLPFRDYYPLIREALLNRWQAEWLAVDIHANKLRAIKDAVLYWTSSRQSLRRHEVILTRLRIGHTLLTHGHLMEGRPPPYCTDCIVPLTVSHILLECPSYMDERTCLIPAPDQRNATLSDVLGEEGRFFDIRNLVTFLQSIDLYSKI